MDRSSSLLAGGPARIEVTGPLAPLAGDFRRGLTDRGFTRHAVAQHTHLMEGLSVWLAAEGLAAHQLVADGVNAFLVDRRAAGHLFLISRRGLEPLLEFLLARGVIPPWAAARPAGPVEELLSQYCLYLVAERGLAPLSVVRYLSPARLFLAALNSPLPAALQELSAAEVTRFLLVEVRRRRTWAAKSLVTALRSLLRFLHVAGHVPVGLAAAVPAVAGWGLASLPRGIGVELVTAMLTCCDRSCAMGRRDYAILLVLARLGLRNGEVCRLEIDDINWQRGEILIRGKGNRHEMLPLPADVGQALVDYLVDGRGSPGRCRRVFVIGRAPFDALSLSAVVSIVGAAARRAGATVTVSPHRLRHTVASDLLAKGAPLAEVGQLLRHSAERTTAIYAKLDYRSLSELVRPWPGAS